MILSLILITKLKWRIVFLGIFGNSRQFYSWKEFDYKVMETSNQAIHAIILLTENKDSRKCNGQWIIMFIRRILIFFSNAEIFFNIPGLLDWGRRGQPGPWWDSHCLPLQGCCHLLRDHHYHHHQCQLTVIIRNTPHAPRPDGPAWGGGEWETQGDEGQEESLKRNGK